MDFLSPHTSKEKHDQDDLNIDSGLSNLKGSATVSGLALSAWLK